MILFVILMTKDCNNDNNDDNNCNNDDINANNENNRNDDTNNDDNNADNDSRFKIQIHLFDNGVVFESTMIFKTYRPSSKLTPLPACLA